MIVDFIDRLSQIRLAGVDLQPLTAFIAQNDLSKMPLGKYEINGSCYFTLKEYRAKKAGEIQWESHRDYIDIQYLLAGREWMGWCPAPQMTGAQAYRADVDAVFYTGAAKPCYIPLSAGMFVLLEPQDAHFPSYDDGTGSYNRKAVIKVKIKP